MEPGQKLPGLELPDQNGETRTLSDLAGPEGLVLYAYPKDDTPGCTVEAKDFRDRLEAFRELGFEVAGLSPDPGDSHCDFIDKYDLTFPLLSDPEKAYMRSIDAFGEKKMYGKTVEGVVRSTLAVTPGGEVIEAWHNVRAKGHAERVLSSLERRSKAAD
jgi:peroxiredoxin Q/BCP